jgi:hypothetical protein
VRWFKHFSDSSSDLFVRELCEQFGDAGYAFWFRTLELIAAQGKDGQLEIPETAWRWVIHSRRTDHLRRLYAFATARGKLQVEPLSNGLLRLKCPKLKELSDEYSRKVRAKSGHSPESSSSTSSSTSLSIYPLKGSRDTTEGFLETIKRVHEEEQKKIGAEEEAPF